MSLDEQAYKDGYEDGRTGVYRQSWLKDTSMHDEYDKGFDQGADDVNEMKSVNLLG